MAIADTLEKIISAVESDEVPSVSPEELPCFSNSDNPNLRDGDLEKVLTSIGGDDLPTLRRALASAREGEEAWLGFKIVHDPESCVALESETQDAGFGEASADGTCGVFFDNKKHDILFSRKYTARDKFQMHDITSGPSMHMNQFPGLTWASVPLFGKVRVMVFGAGDISRYIARYAMDCDFDVVVMDDDAELLAQDRFPGADLKKIDFDDLSSAGVASGDYVCVVTRGHVHDPQALIYALGTDADYIGMIGHVDKVTKNFEQAERSGVSKERLREVHAPIGIKCGAMTHAEIAISIVAELIATRHAARKAAAARAAGEN